MVLPEGEQSVWMPSTSEVTAPKLRGNAYKRVYYRRDRLRRLIRTEARDCMLRLAEVKHVTTSISKTPAAAAGAINCINIISQGTGTTQRVGNQVRARELQLKGSV